MSRGFDGFEIDDFRDSDSGSRRDADRDRSSDWNNRLGLHNIHREEEQADKRDHEVWNRPGSERPSLPREERVEALLSQ